MIAGATNELATSSIVTFRAGPLFSSNLAPFKDVVGEYITVIWPFDNPAKIYRSSQLVNRLIATTLLAYLVNLGVPDDPNRCRIHVE